MKTKFNIGDRVLVNSEKSVFHGMRGEISALVRASNAPIRVDIKSKFHPYEVYREIPFCDDELVAQDA